MSAARVPIWAALLCLYQVGGHRSLPPGVTCGSQFNSSATALEIPNPKISWASYRILTCDAPIFWLKAQVDTVGQNLSFTSSVPAITRFDPVRISTLVVGPGLPALSLADQAKVPADALADIGSGEGAVLFESPADQSSCSHLQSAEMTGASAVRNGRCNFHEPYGDSHMWVVHDETLVAVATGEHRFAVFDAGEHTAKVAFACCDWPEDFTTPFPMPAADCPYCGTKESDSMYSSIFYEKASVSDFAGFPAYENCSGHSDPPTPPAECPNETAAGALVQPESCKLGCSNGECHSHNIFGECTYEMEWITPKPKIGGTEVTSLVIFKGDTVKFARKGHQWPHNLEKMASQSALDTCDFSTSTQILTVEQVSTGTDVQFNTEGTFYYSCGMTGHCAAGQKLKVEVKDSSAGRHCHDHPHGSATGSMTMTCDPGEENVYVLGDASYGAASNQCSEMCASPMGLSWMPTAVKGTCATAGYADAIEKKTVQQAGSPVATEVMLHAMSGNGVSPTCHCHSFEEIKCDATGDALYDEHIVEIQNYCQGIVAGTDTVCPYKCFQPFEVLHLHYLKCDYRQKHALFKQIEAIDKCHMAAQPPFGTQCEVVDMTATRDVTAYDDFYAGPRTVTPSTFETTQILIIFAITVVVAAIIGSLAAWKHEKIEKGMGSFFEVIGRFVGTHPIKVAVSAFFLFFILSAGMSMQEAEQDAAKLWVPDGAIALQHSQYVRDSWPSDQSFTFVLAQPKEGDLGPNVITEANLKSMLVTHKKLMDIEVDGDEIVKDSASVKDYSAEFGGKWTYQGTGSTRAKCRKWGPVCAMQSVLAIFDFDETNIGSDFLDKMDQWDKAPRETIVPGLNLYKGFELSDVMGGIKKDGNGKIQSAEVFMSSMFSTNVEEEVMINVQGRMRATKTDPVSYQWEAHVICALGMQDVNPIDSSVQCPDPAGDLKYNGLLDRSFGDEFGNAVRGDISKIGIAYFLIIIYLFLCLGKRDVVHSMFAMSVAVIVAVGLAYGGSGGLGGFFGIKTNPLNNNIPFLLLGLGVDDAFVLVSELTMHMANNKGASVPELIALTAKTGGASILVTSLTDALAFLVGASTKLPALAGFCLYGGIAVLMCFVLQMVWVLPLLALNIRRVQDNRYDCCCCFKSPVEHSIEAPQGHCCCYAPKCTPTDSVVSKAMKKVGGVVVQTLPGKIFTCIVWTTIFALGCAGSAQIQKDFKLEWFFPETSYVRDFMMVNDEYFSTGTTFSVFTNGLDMCASKDNLNELTSYMKQHDKVKTSSISNWWENFRPDPTVPAAASCGQFYQDVWDWTKTSDGGRYKRSIRWVDATCNKDSTEASCDPSKGIDHTRVSATLNRLESGVSRYNTMAGMRTDVNAIMEDQTSLGAFPFANDFLYWEENGIIDTELTRNLLIAGGIVFVIICIMIPRPRIAVIVSMGICLSIIELLGFLYWWGVSINGTTTIYLLICLGLAVDYSAHIGHIFNISTGTAEERAMEAMTRIGPSVFHAVFSTILAVLVLSLSKSYVFEVFFKVLFLVTFIAGFKGLWLLPVVLSLVGGDKKQEIEPIDHANKVENTVVGNSTGDEAQGA